MTVGIEGESGPQNGKEGEWVGITGRVITRITAEIDRVVPTTELDIYFQCKYVDVAHGGGMRPKPWTADSASVLLSTHPIFEYGMTGVRFWLTGMSAPLFSIFYQIECKHIGVQSVGRDGQQCGDWRFELDDLDNHPRMTRIRLYISSREHPSLRPHAPATTGGKGNVETDV
jgi:hypothetical protein